MGGTHPHLNSFNLSKLEKYRLMTYYVKIQELRTAYS
jgi:hypothetical protein